MPRQALADNLALNISRAANKVVVDYTLPRACIVVGDVSGKGVPAALYAALVSGILRSLARDEPYPADMLNP